MNSCEILGKKGKYIYYRYLIVVNTKGIFDPPKSCYAENNPLLIFFNIIPVNYRKLYLSPKGICNDFKNLTVHMQTNCQLLEINDFSC